MENSKKAVMLLIQEAEKIITEVPSKEIGDKDPRWQAIIAVGEYIEEQPELIWRFIYKWGESSDEDIRMAIANCLLEHLLGFHFCGYFPKVREKCRQSKVFSSAFLLCSQFGQSKQHENSQAFLTLKKEISYDILKN